MGLWGRANGSGSAVTQEELIARFKSLEEYVWDRIEWLQEEFWDGDTEALEGLPEWTEHADRLRRYNPDELDFEYLVSEEAKIFGVSALDEEEKIREMVGLILYGDFEEDSDGRSVR